MPIVSVKPERLAGQLERDYKAILERVRRAVQVEVHVAGPALVDDEIKRARPVPVDRGLYRRSWRTADLPDGVSLFNDSPYASIIENGRRPGSKQPPRQPIFEWIMRKGLTRTMGPEQRGKKSMRAQTHGAKFDRWKRRYDERTRAWALAFVIARAIGRRGQPAHRILAKARVHLDVRVRRVIEYAMLEPMHGGFWAE